MILPELFQSEKALAFYPGWSAPEPETDYCRFTAPLEIGGVVEADFVLAGGCYKHHPEKHITFELRVGAPGVKRKVPLARIDWRSVSGGHSNKRGPKLPWAGKRVGNCHNHDFALNWVEIEQRMRSGNLPQAEPMPEDVQSFESLIEYTGKCFRISNMSIVTRPEWEYGLFYDG